MPISQGSSTEPSLSDKARSKVSEAVVGIAKVVKNAKHLVRQLSDKSSESTTRIKQDMKESLHSVAKFSERLDNVLTWGCDGDTLVGDVQARDLLGKAGLALDELFQHNCAASGLLKAL